MKGATIKEKVVEMAVQIRIHQKTILIKKRYLNVFMVFNRQNLTKGFKIAKNKFKISSIKLHQEQLRLQNSFTQILSMVILMQRKEVE